MPPLAPPDGPTLTGANLKSGIVAELIQLLPGLTALLREENETLARHGFSDIERLAEDKAELLKGRPDEVAAEIERRVRADLRKTGEFKRIHPFPGTSADVPDDLEARLVVLGGQHPYSKEAGNAAETEATAILESRGNTPRLYRNTLVFLAADRARLQDLEEAARRFLAWQSILADKENLNLDPHQVRQAETQRDAADSTLSSRIPEAYQWLLVPGQTNPQAAIEWQASRLSGQEALAVRVSRKLRNDESLITSFAPSRLRMELDRVPLWRGDHVSVQQLVDDFAKYLYLPRLSEPAVLLESISEGLSLTTWELDSFAYADDFDDAAKRYRALHCLDRVTFPGNAPRGLLVKSDIAKLQLDAEDARRAAATEPSTTRAADGAEPETEDRTLELKNVSSGDLDLATEEETKSAEEAANANEDLFSAMKEALGEDVVTKVTVSARLTAADDAPSCVSAEGPVSLEMEKVLSKQPGSEGVKSDKVLELNIHHPVFAVLKAAQEAGDTEKLKKYSDLLYAQAQLIEGLPVDDPAAYAEAVCSLMK